jgi:hypothetical protein
MPFSDVMPSQRQAGMLILAFAAGVAVGANWPAIRQALGPLLAAAGTKVDDLYAAVAQALGEQKEAFQDARAEHRHRARRQRGTPTGESELLTGLASLLKGEGRPAAKRERKRPARRGKPSVRVVPAAAS